MCIRDRPGSRPKSSKGVSSAGGSRSRPQALQPSALSSAAWQWGQRCIAAQTEKDSPQPQLFVAFGLPNLKPRPIRLSSKSICDPKSFLYLNGTQIDFEDN